MNQSHPSKPVKIFVSGCYDILHAGHIQFFEDAKALGDHLTVCFASDEVLMLAKGRKPSIPEDNKFLLLQSIRHIDEVVKSSDMDPVFDFATHVENIKPDILAVTEDDQQKEAKEKFCKEKNIKFIVLSKRNGASNTSTTKILANIKGKIEVPLRVDFAGGWLDVPKFSKKGGLIVNCTISPKVSLENWPYEKGSGLGGSAALALLKIKNGIKAELDLGVGWQDPAVIEETGLCVWRSGKTPVLEYKCNPDWLKGKMLIVWTGKSHVASNIANKKRDLKEILKAGILAGEAVLKRDFNKLCRAVSLSYSAQIDEGMDELPHIKGAEAKKYLGAGHGGYALYLFKSNKARDKALKYVDGSKKIEPCMD